MFYYLEGKVTEIDMSLVVIDCGGVGFAVNTTANTISRVKKGESTRLYTYCNVKEDAFDIYGFASKSEKHSFELLLGVSGVGPKAALSILSSSNPEALAMAVVAGDDKALTAAPGVGKKLAQRIILELKDKLAKEADGLPVKGQAPAAGQGGGSKLGDAVAALTVLGYGSAEISAAIKQIDVDALGLEDIIRQALKLMLRQ
ncbi:MAG TPA: Holliday junction branch migration protein RuvA [Firmicutes bacterium]|nr:Holliday junction branch migration protein RuvA [Bacillota bacterium]